MAHIVVLEDEASTRMLIAGVLKKLGHDVDAYDNGAEGLLCVLAEAPDLLISDIEMPKMTGLEVLAQIRQTADVATTPVILLTARAERSDIREGMRQGADDYLTKPFDPAELAEAVDTQLNKLGARRAAAAQEAQDLAKQKLEQAKAEFEARAASTAQLAAPEIKRTQYPLAWVMHASVLNMTAVANVIGPKDQRTLFRNLYSPSGPESALRTATYVDLLGDSLLTIFTEQPGLATAAVRAAQGACDLVAAGLRTRRWLSTQFQRPDMPELKLGITLHAGPIDMVEVPLGGGISGTRQRAMGHTLDVTINVRNGEPALGWSVIASHSALQGMDNLLRLGAKETIFVGRDELVVSAVKGVAGTLPDTPWL
jgi:DNA-binding response OmpR family regulator